MLGFRWNIRLGLPVVVSAKQIYTAIATRPLMNLDRGHPSLHYVMLISKHMTR